MSNTVTYREIGDDFNAWECSYCGLTWQLTEGNPIENGMKYCPSCGKEIIEIEPFRYDEEVPHA